jgi:hypothetical protein
MKTIITIFKFHVKQNRQAEFWLLKWGQQRIAGRWREPLSMQRQ